LVGGSRYHRLVNDLERKPKGGANGRQVTDSDRAIINAHINTLEFELGFPCSHCKQKNYIRDTGKNWTSLYKEYLVYHKENVVLPPPSVATTTGVIGVGDSTITTYENSVSSNAKSGLSKRSKQRKPGTPVSYDTWRQYLSVVYSHVQFQKYVIIICYVTYCYEFICTIRYSILIDMFV